MANPQALRLFDKRESAPIAQFMRDYVDSGKSAGMQTVVYQQDKIVHQACYGYADIASRRPITPDSIFRLYSMTKPITSVALMTLMEQGHFELDDAAKRWLPALGKLQVDQQGALESDITLRQLLTHTAGFSYGFEPDSCALDQQYHRIWRQRSPEQSLAEVMSQLLELPLLYQPGTRWHYSIATDICGYLIELMSDMPLLEYLQKTIFAPLDLVDTAFEVSADKIDRFTTLYGYSETNPLAQLEQKETSAFIPVLSGNPTRLYSGGAGLTSTAADYLRFARMMLNQGELEGSRILQPETVKMMTQNHLPQALLPIAFNGVAKGPYRGYGFGFGYAVTIDTADTGAAGSPGDFGWGGLADTYCWIDPEQQLIGLLLQQFQPSLHHAGRKDFRNCVYRALR